MQVHCVISVIDALNIWHGRGSAMQFLPWLNLRETATGTFHTASDFPFSELIIIQNVYNCVGFSWMIGWYCSEVLQEKAEFFILWSSVQKGEGSLSTLLL